MNEKRRTAVGNMILDVAKYFLTSIAVGTFVIQNIKPLAFVVSLVTALILVVLAYYTIPKDKEEE